MSEKLAMFTPKTCNLEGLGGGGEITWEMVAGALTGLNQEVYLYARLKFVQDDTCLGELKDLVYLNTINEAFWGGWKLSKNEDVETIGRLANMAIDESVNPLICKSCNGSGMINNKGECHVCKGIGEGREASIKRIQKRLKVTEHRATHFWRDKLRGLLSAHIGWDQDISEALKKLNNK